MHVPILVLMTLLGAARAAQSTTATAQVQSASQVQTLSAELLQKSAQEVSVSPGFTTVLEFERAVKPLASGSKSLMQVEVRDNRVYLSARESSGMTDLVMELDGKLLLFTVKVRPGTGARLYQIRSAARVPSVPAAKVPAVPATAAPATPRPPAYTGTASGADVVRILRERQAAASAQPAVKPTTPAPASPPKPAAPAAAPASPAAAAQGGNGARNGTLVWANFEREVSGRLVSAMGGVARVTGYQQNAQAPVQYSGMRQAAPPLLVLKAGGELSQRAYFDFSLPAPNEWAMVNAEVRGWPSRAVNVLPYRALNIDLSASGLKYVRLTLYGTKNSDLGLIYDLPVAPGFKTYVVPLSSFAVPAYYKGDVVKAFLTPNDVLGNLKTVMVGTRALGSELPAKGRVTMDNIRFVR